MPLDQTHPLNKMSARNIPEVKGWPVSRFSRICGSVGLLQTSGPPQPITRTVSSLQIPLMYDSTNAKIIAMISLFLVRDVATYNTCDHRNKTRNSIFALIYNIIYQRTWQPYRHLWADCLDNVGSLTPHNPIGLQGLLRGQLYFTSYQMK
jgi:hypothetical protein